MLSFKQCEISVKPTQVSRHFNCTLQEPVGGWGFK